MRRAILVGVALTFASLWALEIPKESGEWVYFRDEEAGSYIGILSYDDSTIQARSVGKSKLALYLTLDYSKGYLDFSGERIESEKKAEDAALINHIHEVLWALGDVAEGFVVSRGQLLSSEDKSFEEFPGFEKLAPKKHTFRRNKKAQKVDIDLGEESLILDEEWVAIAQNCWALGAVANLTTAKVDGAPSEYLIKKLTESSDGAYKNLATLKVTKSPNYRLAIEVYDKATNALMYNVIKLIPTKAGDNFFFYSITVMADVYNKNKKYFDAIENSYTIMELP